MSGRDEAGGIVGLDVWGAMGLEGLGGTGTAASGCTVS